MIHQEYCIWTKNKDCPTNEQQEYVRTQVPVSMDYVPKAQWTGIHRGAERSGDLSFPLPLTQHSGEQGG